MQRHGHLVTAWSNPGFIRLFMVRVAGQFGDGVFQASLAGAVLFNPERQAHAADVAAGFTVLLLPYSIIGPFAGVLLDRWWRQRVLVWSNVCRVAGVVLVAGEILIGVHGLPFYATALFVVSISRFFLSALSASLPHLVSGTELVTANALTTTVGAVATTLGGGTAVGVRALAGSSNTAYAAIAVAAALPYAVAALAARVFETSALGPDDIERDDRETIGAVARGLVAGGRHIYERTSVLYGLTAIGVARLCSGISTVCTLLLYRNYFHDQGFFRAGLSGLAQVVVAIAVGGGLAALATPVAVRTLGFARWPAILLAGAAVVQVGLALPFRMPLLLLAAWLLGFASQGIKITVDTLVQRDVEDDYRGRVFALYDMLFNVALVAAAVFTALALPENGHSPTSVVVIGAIYALTAVIYLRAAARVSQPVASTSP